MMGRPQVEIEVDDATGRWSVDGLPMILVPQHFFLNNHFACEAALGPERLEEILRPAGYRSAYHWCEREAAHHGLSGIAVFHHYMKRLSQRGWGQFEVTDIDLDRGTATARVRNSAFVDAERRRLGRKACYIFGSWFEGSLAYVAAAAGRELPLEAHEVSCAAEGEHDHCTFAIGPRA